MCRTLHTLMRQRSKPVGQPACTKRLEMDGELCALDFAMLRHPVDQLTRATRGHNKEMEKELSDAVERLEQMNTAPMPMQLAAVDQVIEQLRGLKRKAEDEWQLEEDAHLQRVRVRLDHLAQPSDVVNRKRTARLVSDFLLREVLPKPFCPKQATQPHCWRDPTCHAHHGCPYHPCAHHCRVISRRLRRRRKQPA